MKITLEVQESKFTTFLAFIKTLDYVTLPATESVPQWQIDEAVKRLSELENYPERSGDFDAMVNDIEKEYGL